MRIVKFEEGDDQYVECFECESEAGLQIEFEMNEEPIPICRTCLVVLRWHMEQLEDE